MLVTKKIIVSFRKIIFLTFLCDRDRFPLKLTVQKLRYWTIFSGPVLRKLLEDAISIMTNVHAHTQRFSWITSEKIHWLLPKNHGFSSIACSATYFGFHGCHVLFGIMSSILCGYGMPDTGPRDGSICRFCQLSCKRLGTHTLNIICKLF